MNATWDIAVIGGGAAGLAAAIFAAQTAPALRVAVFDGTPKLGAKILVSGGARCNVTHERVTADDFNGPRHLIRHILAAFDERAAVRWCESMGVNLKREETGKLFPVTDSAQTVLAALLRRCDELGITILTNHRVHNISANLGLWTLDFGPDHSAHTAHRVIMATGGRSLPKTGSDGGGWSIVQALGHTVTPTYPALVPLVLAPTMFHEEMSGVSLNVELNTFADGKLIDRRTGSLLWTHFGISGPVVMDASRHWVIAHAEGRKPRLCCSFLPGVIFADAEQWLIRATAAQPKKLLSAVLQERLPARLADLLPRHIHLQPDQPVGQLPREDRRRLVHALLELELPVLRDRGWNYAEVTAGGVPLSEIDHRTMASRRVPGLYLIGEMLDCDGRIGGFNFQWAWSTGYLAGRTAALAAGAKSDEEIAKRRNKR